MFLMQQPALICTYIYMYSVRENLLLISHLCRLQSPLIHFLIEECSSGSFLYRLRRDKVLYYQRPTMQERLHSITRLPIELQIVACVGISCSYYPTAWWISNVCRLHFQWNAYFCLVCLDENRKASIIPYLHTVYCWSFVVCLLRSVRGILRQYAHTYMCT